MMGRGNGKNLSTPLRELDSLIPRQAVKGRQVGWKLSTPLRELDSLIHAEGARKIAVALLSTPLRELDSLIPDGLH